MYYKHHQKRSLLRQNLIVKRLRDSLLKEESLLMQLLLIKNGSVDTFLLLKNN